MLLLHPHIATRCKPMSSTSIRRATPADSPAVSHICLLTGDSGKSAVHLFSKPELLGLVYAEPYVNLSSSTFGFLLVSKEVPKGEEKVVGYILGAADTKIYEEELERVWWPSLRIKYPVDGEGTKDDQHYYKMFAKPHRASPDILEFYPAHIHIDILPEYQRQGWGKKLMGAAVEHLRSVGKTGLHVGVSLENEDGERFYNKLGFKPIQGPGGAKWLGLDFDAWA